MGSGLAILHFAGMQDLTPGRFAFIPGVEMEAYGQTLGGLFQAFLAVRE
jgi:hypothetical protein